MTPVPYLSETIRILQHFDKTLKPLELKEPPKAVEAPKTEVREKVNPFMPDFTWFGRYGADGEPEEIALEITYFREPTVVKPGHYISPRDPAYDGGEVNFGAANIVGKDGTLTPTTLTELELEAAEEAFWNP